MHTHVRASLIVTGSIGEDLPCTVLSLWDQRREARHSIGYTPCWEDRILTRYLLTQQGTNLPYMESGGLAGEMSERLKFRCNKINLRALC